MSIFVNENLVCQASGLTPAPADSGFASRNRSAFCQRRFDDGKESRLSPSGPTTTFLYFHINDPTYTVNGAAKAMDTAPVIVESRTFLPIRYVVETIGAKVDWYAPDQKVTITLSPKTIELWIGQNRAIVDGKLSVPIDSANPKIVPSIQPPGRTMMPLRFIAENLGCKVDWLSPAEARITYPAP